MLSVMHRSQKQEDREKVIKQKKVNVELKDEVLEMNYQQQRLREQETLLKIDIKSLTQRIVLTLFHPPSSSCDYYYYYYCSSSSF